MTELVQRFAELFAGRTDAYGEEDGGCARTTIALWRLNVERHLNGDEPIGIYPMVQRGSLPAPAPSEPGWYCKWGCVDFDIKSPNHPTYDYETHDEAREAARRLWDALHHVGITGWIETTRSWGRHVWVFAREWVPAATMRRALLVACQVANVPTREVNPKQETLAEGQLGNYVRLPYPGHMSEIFDVSTRVVEMRDGTYMALSSFVDAALTFRAQRGDLERVAALYTPPAKIAYGPPRRPWSSYSGELSALGKTMLEGGPLPGMDRSGWLYKLCCVCAESGLTPGEAVAVLQDADARLAEPKFARRTDATLRYQEIANRSYGGSR